MINNIEELKKQPALSQLLIVLMDNQDKYLSTLNLLANGILCPAAGIARLKEKGVLIETIYQSIIDGSGRSHKKVACYKIVGGAAI